MLENRQKRNLINSSRQKQPKLQLSYFRNCFSISSSVFLKKINVKTNNFNNSLNPPTLTVLILYIYNCGCFWLLESIWSKMEAYKEHSIRLNFSSKAWLQKWNDPSNYGTLHQVLIEDSEGAQAFVIHSTTCCVTNLPIFNI